MKAIKGGKDNKKIDVNKKIYECSTCGELFNWTSDSSWYGSYKEMDECTIKHYFCSEPCIYNPDEH